MPPELDCVQSVWPIKPSPHFHIRCGSRQVCRTKAHRTAPLRKRAVKKKKKKKRGGLVNPYQTTSPTTPFWKKKSSFPFSAPACAKPAAAFPSLIVPLEKLTCLWNMACISQLLQSPWQGTRIQHLHAIESNGSSRGGSCNSTGSVPFSGSAAVRSANCQPGLAGCLWLPGHYDKQAGDGSVASWGMTASVWLSIRLISRKNGERERRWNGSRRRRPCALALQSWKKFAFESRNVWKRNNWTFRTVHANSIKPHKLYPVTLPPGGVL